jgi:predicted DNA-binding helix-hairpin-helix protein
MPRPNSTSERTRTTERLSVNVSTATAEALREMAESKTTTVTEVIRRAVAVLKLLEDAQQEGATVQLVRPNQPIRELHLI